MQITHSNVVQEDKGNNKQPTRGFSRAFIALRSRNFRLFWSGQFISLIGTWMQTMGQAWLVLQLTHSAWWLGVVGALQFIPVLLFSLFSGVIADNVPKRKLLIFTQIFSMLLAAILWLLVTTHTVQLWHVLVLATLLGVSNSLDMPVRQAFVVEMVGREALPNAIALNSSIFNMARILGPGIGGLLIGWFGEGPLFLLNAISFLPVFIGLFLMRDRELFARPERSLDHANKVGTLKSLREGLAYIRHMPAVLLIITTVGVISLFGINFNVMLPLFADSVLRIGPQGFGFISAAIGLGALLSSLWLAWGGRKPQIKAMLISGLIFGLGEIVFSLSHWYLLSLILIALVGFAQIALTSTANAALQTVTPDHLRGRIMSVYIIVFVGSNPIGNLLMGGLAHMFTPALALLLGALPCVLAAIVAWFLRAPAEKSMQTYVHEA
ncbi:MAG: MFS transporter [Ktedonobacteraceae bacterium]